MQKIATASKYIFYGLLAYVPVHIFVSTVLGVNLGFLDLAKALKDVVLVFGFCLIFLASTKKPWFKKWLYSKTTLLILAYAGLTLLLALIRPTDTDAEILGIVFNLRFLLFFLYAVLLTGHFSVKKLREDSLKIVFWTGGFVVMFGIFQYFVLPNNALTSIGFERSNGVLPAFFIDDKPDLERVMSTLRDPNSLGSYLIIISSLVIAKLYLAKKKDKKLWLFYGLATLLCSYLTFSRSAWLGLSAMFTVFALFALKNHVIDKKLLTKKVVLITSAFVLVFVSSLFLARDTYYVRNVILHSDEATVQEDPNELRLRFWQESVDAILENPAGHGPGTAGLASIKNDIQGTELNENYYLQITYETGVVGLILLLTILVTVFHSLFLQAGKNQFIVWALIAGFAGLAVTNFLVHIWSNEAVAYTWWGLAGLYVLGSKGVESLVVVREKE